MNGIFTGISRMLWFFYRVIYTLLPATMFVVSLYAFIHYNFIDGHQYDIDEIVLKQRCVKEKPVGPVVYYENEAVWDINCPSEHTYNIIETERIVKKAFEVKEGDFFLKFLFYVYKAFHNLSFSSKTLMTILLIIFVDVVVEAMVLRVTYRALNFQKVCDDMYKDLRVNAIPYRTRFSSSFTVFNLMAVRSLITDGKVADRIEYLLAREFLFNNTWMLLLIATTLFVPHTLLNVCGHENDYEIFWMLFGFIFSVLTTSICWKAIVTTKKSEVYDHFEGDNIIPVKNLGEAFLNSNEFKKGYKTWMRKDKVMKRELKQLWVKQFKTKIVDRYGLASVNNNSSSISSIYDNEKDFLESNYCKKIFKNWLNKVERDNEKRELVDIILTEKGALIKLVDLTKDEPSLGKTKKPKRNERIINIEKKDLENRLNELDEKYEMKERQEIENKIDSINEYLNVNNSKVKIDNSKCTHEVLELKKYLWYIRINSIYRYFYNIFACNYADIIKMRYGNEKQRDEIKIKRKRTLVMRALFALFVAALIILALLNVFEISNYLVLSLGWYISILLIVFVVTYFLLASAFGEYLDVEKTVYAYFMHELNIREEKFVLKPVKRIYTINNNSLVEPPETDDDSDEE